MRLYYILLIIRFYVFIDNDKVHALSFVYDFTIFPIRMSDLIIHLLLSEIS